MRFSTAVREEMQKSKQNKNSGAGVGFGSATRKAIHVSFIFHQGFEWMSLCCLKKVEIFITMNEY